MANSANYYGNWRLIPYEEHDAAFNMAADEAILEEYLQGLVPPTLRLYGFKPAAVSFGYTQKIPLDIIERMKQRGYDVVRRPTGGRAVLHVGDLTYSFVGSEEFLGTSVSQAYRKVCMGLMRAFEPLSINLELGSARADYRQIHDCFLATTGSDLHVNGKKLAGSAQLRRRGAVLQHGSILLQQDQTLMPALLGAPVDSAASGQRHANLFELAKRHIGWRELEFLIKSGFETAFAVKFVESQFSDNERKRIYQTCRPIQEMADCAQPV